MRKNIRFMVLCLFLSLQIISCGDNPDGSTDGDVDLEIMESEDTGESDFVDTEAEIDGDIENSEMTEIDGDLEDETEIEPDMEACESAEGEYADPWTVMSTDELPELRNWKIKRGIVHTHSPYSHDACDNEPEIDGVRNEQCYIDCRVGMCETAQDFVFLTDHDDLFAYHEYPDVLLYQEGDTLITRNEMPVANRLNCGDGKSVIVAAGTETEMMPIGLEHHVGSTPAERVAAYNASGEDAVIALQNAGAKVFLQHTEGWDTQDLINLPIDGIEVYNLHQNLMDNMAKALEMVLTLATKPETLPVIELSIITIFMENELDLEKWSKTLMVKPMVAISATDSHRNVFKGETEDGERLDSFRRMMHWFSNYVLVPEGEIDDLILKNTIAKGRFYSAFDYLGYPVDFDFHGEKDGEIYEMGDNVTDSESVTMTVKIPEIYNLDPCAEKPVFRAILLRANDGEWEEVASSDSDISAEVQKGAYRAEIRMIPNHLTSWLGNEPENYLDEKIWVYSNPIYVNMYGEK